ncbi:uncharacterized protein LOC125039978 [Penaeus chinensis]|uniref:uncharacterized protein LOC125039978 n=1 Tax=Penaeus chinensis TaxID=139456 RepID=UPI001FB78272|nr:uncharacterized protein LOC125039978 [Penaeus chinensis]
MLHMGPESHFTAIREVYSAPQSVKKPDQPRAQSTFRDTAARNHVPPVRTGFEEELDFTEDRIHTAPGSTGIAAAGQDRCPVSPGTRVAQGLGCSSTSAMTEPRSTFQTEEESTFTTASAITEPKHFTESSLLSEAVEPEMEWDDFSAYLPDIPEEDWDIEGAFLPTSELDQLLEQFQELFDGGKETVGHIPGIRHQIDTEDAKPVRVRQWRLPQSTKETIRQQCDSMLQSGVIEASCSPWLSPVVLVKKKDGSLRFCVDYRGLNAVTKKDTYPLPRIDALIDELGPTDTFTTLDARAAH